MSRSRDDGKVLRFFGVHVARRQAASPTTTIDQERLWLTDVDHGQDRANSTGHAFSGTYDDVTPGRRTAAGSRGRDAADNIPSSEIHLHNVEDGTHAVVTSDRFDSWSPTCGAPDGKWLYFLSDREFRSVVGSPWGPRAPEPFFDRQKRASTRCRWSPACARRSSRRTSWAAKDDDNGDDERRESDGKGKKKGPEKKSCNDEDAEKRRG